MLHRMIFYGLLFLIAFTPLAFGTTETWSLTVMVLLILLLTSAYASRLILSGRVALPAPALLGLFLLFTLLVFCQAIPLPHRTFTFLGFSRSTGSVDAYATSTAALKALCYGMVFFLVPHFFSQTADAAAAMPDVYAARCARTLRFVSFLIFFSFALSVFALIQHFTFNGKIYWWKELTLGGSPFGPFVNRNHYAGYMELTIPLVLGFVFTRDTLAERWPLYLFMAIIMSASLLLSLSRTGILSFFCQLLVLPLLLRLPRGQRFFRLKDLATPALLLLLLLLFVLWLGFEPLARRMSTLTAPARDQLYPGRYDVWLDTLTIFKVFPWLGSGLGTFPIMHCIYKSRATDAIYLEAHNDYLQILSETGVLGAGVLFLFGVGVLARALRLLSRERDRALAALRAGALTACLGMLLHSLTDFNLQIPSNALLFFILAGLTTMPGLHQPVQHREGGVLPTATIGVLSH